jgi:UDP-N-acetylmuramoylalanine--D-glutamate ligase
VKPRPPLPEGPYLVVGLARSGAAAARALAAHGEVIGCDLGAPPQAAELDGVEVHLEEDGVALLPRVRTLVKSPGVPAAAPVVVAARERGTEVVGELEVAWRLLPNEFIAVTGTNGKTTTCELLGAIYREAGAEVAVAGNVGTPLSSLVGQLADQAVVVCEASSFQLEDAVELAPECAVLVNLAEDHLDRHVTLDAYREAKLRIFARQEPGDVAVAPEGIEVPGPARVVRFGGPGSELALHEELSWANRPLLSMRDIRLRGAHNRENAMAAAAAALARGVPPEPVAAALQTFAGVPHRLEEVATSDGVLYVNDSKATNVESTRVGIEAFDAGVHLILGGRPKGAGFGGLRDAVASHCRACYLIGEAAPRLAADLAGTVPLHDCGDLAGAVGAASEAARAGEVVLLSPACASYDQYRDFEERGEHFRRLAGTRGGPPEGVTP